MSNHIMDRIWWRDDFDDLIDHLKVELPGSGRSLKWVLVALADNASDEGFCWPSVETIAQKTSLTPRSVQRAIKQAIRVGILRRRLRTNRTSQYLFNLDLLPQGKPGKTRRGGVGMNDFESEPDLFEAANDPFESVCEDAEDGVTFMQDGVTSTTSGVTSVQSRGDTLSPKPSVEPPREPPLEPSVAETAPDADADNTETLFEKMARLSKEGRLPVKVEPVPPLREFFKVEWDKLKGDFPNLGHARAITDAMIELAKARAKEFADVGKTPQEVLAVAFEEIRKSRFLTGQAPPGPGRTSRFRLTPSYLLKPHIFREVINGKYADTAADNGNFDPSTGEVLGPAAAATRGTIERLRNARQRPVAGGNP